MASAEATRKTGLTMRVETPADFDAVRRVLVSAFESDDEASLVERLREDEAFVPALSIVADEDGEVVGHIVLTRALLDDREVLALGPLAVRPVLQNRGIGTALVRDALARARALGAELVVVLGHPAYYPRFGFAPASELHVTSDYPEDAFMALELIPGSARGGGHVTYARPFGDV